MGRRDLLAHRRESAARLGTSAGGGRCSSNSLFGFLRISDMYVYELSLLAFVVNTAVCSKKTSAKNQEGS